MRLIHIMLLIALPALLPASADARPFVLLFDLTPDKGASQLIAREASSAVRTYLRESGKVDVVPFSPELPIVRRAVVENMLKNEDIVGVTLPEQRLRIAKAVGADYACAGSVAQETNEVSIRVWLGQAGSNKAWEQKHSASAAGPGLRATPLNVSNALQSAASIAVARIVSEALADLPTQRVSTPQPSRNPLSDSSPEADAEKHVEQGDSFLKQGVMARAVDEYRRAVNKEPRNPAIRIKLARAYVALGWMGQAAGELERAQSLDPENREISEMLVAVYEAKGAPELAAEVYLERARQNPDDIESRLEAAEVLRRQGRFDEAAGQLYAVVKEHPKNPVPRERLALLSAQRGMFDDSRLHLVELKKLVTDEPEALAINRYNNIRRVFDTQIRHALEQFDGASRQFENEELTHEKYYGKIEDLLLSLNSLIRLMESIEPPMSLERAHRHRLLGCSLITQYGTMMLSYLETKNEGRKREALMLLDAAKAEIQTAAAVDGQ